MRITYNLLLHIVLILFLPILPAVFLHRKYRGRVGKRLGFGLGRKLDQLPRNQPRVWIHALSVGEVTSALPLILGLRSAFPGGSLVCSATTSSGLAIAERLVPGDIPVIPSPVDHPLIVAYFISVIRPDIFILVETDFWPNWLLELQSRAIPAVLVNGRISAKSARKYHRFSLFCQPLFRSFSLLSMQTAVDIRRMLALGVPEERLVSLGNLKYDSMTVLNAAPDTVSPELSSLGFAASAPLWICGSTHPGEEAMLLAAYRTLLQSYPSLQLMIAPRDPGRAEAVEQLCRSHGFAPGRRTRGSRGQVLLLDTLGELGPSYRHATVAFIGGSLVAAGGHNPIEAAAFGIPTIFGPHMEDFAEISGDLVACGGAFHAVNASDLSRVVQSLLADRSMRRHAGERARSMVAERSGVVRSHIGHIEQLLRA